MFIQQADAHSELHALPTTKELTLIVRIMSIDSTYAKKIKIEEVVLTDSWHKLKPTIQSGKTFLKAQLYAVIKGEYTGETPSQTWDEKVMLLVGNDLLLGYDLVKYQKALCAKWALAEAKKQYEEIMAELGAEHKSEGTYGDIVDWYHIPGVPGVWSC